MDFGLVKTLVLIVLLPPVTPMLVIVAAWCLRRRRGAGALFGLGLALLWFSATDAAGQWLTQQVLAPPSALRLANLPRGPKRPSWCWVAASAGTCRSTTLRACNH